MKSRFLILMVLVLSLVSAACGSDGGDSASGTAETEEAAGTEAPTATEGGAASGDPIKVGFLASLSGPAAPWGTAEEDAADVVVEDINESGGVLGRPIELVKFDDTTDPTETARGAQQLIEEGVVAIVGPGFGSGALAAAPITNKAEVPIVAMVGTLGVTDPEQEFFPYTFRSAVSDENAIPAIWERLQQDGHKRIAVFAEETAYGQLGIDGFKELAQESGGEMEIVEAVTAAQDATDVTPQATRIRDADPDAIVLQTGVVGLTGSFVRATENVGLDAPMYGGLGLSQAALMEALGKEGEGRVITLNMFNPDDPSPDQQELVDLMNEANAEISGFANILGANGVVIIAEAIEEAGEASGPAIKEALESGMEIDAYALAPYQFGPEDHAGLGNDAIVWTTVEDGKFVKVD